MNESEANTAGCIAQSAVQMDLIKVTSDDPGWVETILLEAGTWRKAAAILERVGMPPTEDNKRMVRDLASQSRMLISGQEGYLHLENSTLEEVNKNTERWLSQAKEMISRYCRVRKTAHAILERKKAAA